MKYLIIPIIIMLVVGGIIIMKKQNVPIESIKSLTLNYSTGNAYLANVEYKLMCEEKCIARIKLEGVEEEDAKEVEVKEETIKEIIDFLNDKQVYRWDHFQKSDKNVLDGYSFSFYLHEKNERSIEASGYMKFPKNYQLVREKLDTIFKGLIKED